LDPNAEPKCFGSWHSPRTVGPDTESIMLGLAGPGRVGPNLIDPAATWPKAILAWFGSVILKQKPIQTY